MAGRPADTAPKQCLRAQQIRTGVAEALLPKIIGHAAAGDLPGTPCEGLRPSLERQLRTQVPVQLQVPHQDAEAVPQQAPPAQLAAMGADRQDLDPLAGQGGPVGVLALGGRHREPLAGHGAPVLESGEPHVGGRHPGQLRQPACHPFGIGARLAHPQESVVAFPVRLEAELLLDLEIPGLHPQPAPAQRCPVDPGQVLKGDADGRRRERIPGPVGRFGRTHSDNSTTARAAIPSPRPVKPICSVVVALTFTRCESQPRSEARVSRMAGM